MSSSAAEEKSGDVEAPLLHPSMQENPGFIWAFIRKVYSILTVQYLATIAVAAAVEANPPVAIFFKTTWGGWAAYLAVVIAVLVVMVLLGRYQNKHPLNYLLLVLFTVCFGLVFGLLASFIGPTIVLEAATAIVAVVVALTVYTFWAARRSGDFNSPAPFLLTLAIAVILFIIYVIFFPVGKIWYMLYNWLFVLLFSVYITFYTQYLVELNAYDEYIGASIILYLGLFVSIFKIAGAIADRR